MSPLLSSWRNGRGRDGGGVRDMRLADAGRGEVKSDTLCKITKIRYWIAANII